MYNTDMKALLKYAIELDINDLRTFNGYKSGDILSFTSSKKEVIFLIRNYCNILEINTNTKINNKTREYEVFCEFGFDRFSTEDASDIYDLKS